MRKITILLSLLLICNYCFSQDSKKAKSYLDEVSEKMSSYKDMFIVFKSSLINKEAGINENNEPPIKGKISLKDEKYNLEYLGNTFIFDGKKLYIINDEEKEINITQGDLEEEDGFIYPSKLLTFYKVGYTFEWGEIEHTNGKKIQIINLFPMDSNSDIVKVQLGIDTKTKHIYKLAQIGSNGSITTFTITAFKGNAQVSEKLFVFDKEKYLKLNYTID